MTTAGTIAMRPHIERFYDAGGTPEQNPQRAYREGVRRENRRRVFAHYGTACACCDTTEDLTIDHIHGDGKQHREETGSGERFYRWLIKNDFPAGFQTLCMACNLSKADGEYCRMHHNVCPTCNRPLDDEYATRRRRPRSVTAAEELQRSA